MRLCDCLWGCAAPGTDTGVIFSFGGWTSVLSACALVWRRVWSRAASLVAWPVFIPRFSVSRPPGRPAGINNARVRNARLAAQEAAEQATPAGAASATAGRGGGGAGAPPLLPVSAMEPTAGWSRAEAAHREAERRDEAVSEYLRQINWWFLVCFVLSSVWVSNGGTCVRLVGGRGALAVSVLRLAFFCTCSCILH